MLLLQVPHHDADDAKSLFRLNKTVSNRVILVKWKIWRGFTVERAVFFFFMSEGSDFFGVFFGSPRLVGSLLENCWDILIQIQCEAWLVIPSHKITASTDLCEPTSWVQKRGPTGTVARLAVILWLEGTVKNRAPRSVGKYAVLNNPNCDVVSEQAATAHNTRFINKVAMWSELHNRLNLHFIKWQPVPLTQDRGFAAFRPASLPQSFPSQHLTNIEVVKTGKHWFAPTYSWWSVPESIILANSDNGEPSTMIFFGQIWITLIPVCVHPSILLGCRVLH